MLHVVVLMVSPVVVVAQVSRAAIARQSWSNIKSLARLARLARSVVLH